MIALWVAPWEGAEAAEAGQYLPVGIVFPQSTHAIDADAAALPFEPVRALQLDFSPSAFSSGANRYGATFTHATGTWGLGVGYSGEQGGGSNTLAHAISAGGAVRISSVGLGVSLSSPIINSSFSPDYAASLQIGISSALQFAAVLHSIPNTISRMDLGLGYRQAGKFMIEGGVRIPFFTDLFDSGQSRSAYLAGALFTGPVGAVLGLSSDFSDLGSPGWGAGVLWEASRNFKLTLLWNDGGLVAAGPTADRGRMTLGLSIAL